MTKLSQKLIKPKNGSINLRRALMGSVSALSAALPFAQSPVVVGAATATGAILLASSPANALICLSVNPILSGATDSGKTNNTACGLNAKAGPGSTDGDTAYGNQSVANGKGPDAATAVGSFANATGGGATAVGNDVVANGAGAAAFGGDDPTLGATQAVGDKTTAVGAGRSCRRWGHGARQWRNCEQGERTAVGAGHRDWKRFDRGRNAGGHWK
ncbi:hypothetical protein [Methylocystis sp. SB2]|uniref:hypothetical protein n=1 Tax=Methylocystis sp. (strain SB2) TaxID=743836 RepID=UPI001EFA8E6B|nr:hypothetical protein [Methylocystis sp. SB2]ULO23251.1 hypothetical protein LNB28_14050 [Methylocystis sp. SB2]